MEVAVPLFAVCLLRSSRSMPPLTMLLKLPPLMLFRLPLRSLPLTR